MDRVFLGSLIAGSVMCSSTVTAQITVDPLPSSSLCTNFGYPVDFTTVGVFNPPNVFTLEMSDMGGSFAAPTVVGTLAATGSGTITGTIPLGTAPGTGYLIRVNSDDPPMTGIVYGTALTVFPAPSAGLDNAVTICSTAPSIDAFSSLGGTPDPGGVWTVMVGAGVMVGNLYLGAAPMDVLRYTVTDGNGCIAIAQLFIDVITAPDAGIDATITVCSTDSPFSMFAQLGGTPDAGGTWTTPGGGAHPNSFDPSVDVPGVYTYTVMGTPPCNDDVSTLTVMINTAPNAGLSSTIMVCSTDLPVSLFSSLGGSPDLGGTWSGPSPITGTYDPAIHLSGIYTYTVNGMPPCTDDFATVIVTENQPPNAGVDSTMAWCLSDGAFNMDAYAAGSPDPGGSWTYLGSPHGNVFDPAVDASGDYVYTVPGVAPCLNALSTLTVNVNTLCMVATPVPLLPTY